MRAKTLTIILGTMTLCILTLGIAVRFLWLSNVAQLEAESLHQDLKHAAQMVEWTLRQMDVTAQDWAYWDDTYQFMLDRNVRYIQSNLGVETLKRLRLSLMALVDRQGRIVHATAWDVTRSRPAQVPKDLAAKLVPGSPLLAPRTAGEGCQGVLVLSEGPMLVAARPILTSNAKGPSRGILLFGRLVDESASKELQQLARLSITVRRFSELAQASDGPALQARLEAQTVAITPQHGSAPRGLILIRDVAGEPALALELPKPRGHFRQASQGLRLTFAALVIAGLVFALTTVWLLQRMVLSRVLGLIEDIRRVGAEGADGQRVEVRGSDELAALAEAVNDMLTRLEQSQETIRQAEWRFRDIALSMSDWIWEVDQEGRHTYCSDRVAEVLGFSPQDLMGQPIWELFSESDEAEIRQRLRTLMADGRRLENIVGWADGPNGRRAYIQLSGAPVYSADGQLMGYRGVGSDLSDRWHAAETQRLAAVGRLAGGVAHEFNNLLASMTMAAELATMIGTEERYQALARTVLLGCARGARICTSLSRFALPEEPKRAPVAIKDVLAAALAMAEREIANSGVHVIQDYKAEDAVVYADHRQLEQVFLNLIVNACQAMPHGGDLRISTQLVPSGDGVGEVVVSVEDNGVGIAPEDLPRVFEPFFTTKGSLGGSTIPGTGLGLSLAHSLVKAHGGTITVTSQPGVRTVFEVRLAAWSGTAEPAAQWPPAGEPKREAVEPRRVLVVEDDDAVREMIVGALSLSGYQVVAVASAEEAVSELGNAPYHLVVTDMLMPGGGGEAVLAAARAMENAPPVLVVTGRAEAGVRVELMAQGAAGYLAKPFTVSQLVSQVATLLHQGTPSAPST